MPTKPETKFRVKVRERLKSVPNAWFESIQQRAIAGTPDLLGSVNGYFVALELKATSSSPVSALQDHKLRLIAKSGGVAYVVHPDNLEVVLEILKNLGEG